MKKILFHSNYSRIKTGFGTNTRNVLRYLYNTGKYEIYEYAMGIQWNGPETKTVPWKCFGTLPENETEVGHIKDPGAQRMIHYGSWYIERVLKEVKPDIYIGADDLWGFANYWNKPWWNKIPCAIWTTLDSLPILPQATVAAPLVKNFWVWASFAEKALKKQGFDHVQTLPGMIDTSFKPIIQEHRLKLRRAFNIDDDCLVFGFVFRNQLRKLVHTLLDGFAQFKKSNKNAKAKLLLHTNYNEQWDIARFIQEFNLDNNDVLTTYYCRACKNFYVVPFTKNGEDCKICKTKGSAGNITVNEGLNQEQLNYVYNLMDAYVHPMTSGGLEIPIAEAMLCGLPVATVPYSCGEDFTQHKFVYPIQFNTYREAQSNFIKANALPSSIKTFMEKVYKNREQYKAYGLQGLKWATEYFDNNRIGKFLEDFIDNSETTNYQFDFDEKSKNENYPNPDIQDDTEWLMDIYKNILFMDENANTEGLKHWLKRLSDGVTRQQIYDFFIKEAKQFNAQRQKFEIRDFIKKTDKKKMVYVMPGSFGDGIISLTILKMLKRDYPDWEIYVCSKAEFHVVYEPFVGDLIDGLLPYVPVMDYFKFWEGGDKVDKVVDICFQPYFITQLHSSYTHNGLDLNYLQHKTIDLNSEANSVDWTLQTK